MLEQLNIIGDQALYLGLFSDIGKAEQEGLSLPARAKGPFTIVNIFIFVQRVLIIRPSPN